ncbi:MAG: glycine zipper 2TM domain-containing protein [Paracoccaceae bacterium]
MKKILIIISLLIISGCQSVTGPAVLLKPVKVCGDVKVPIYGVLDRPTSSGEVVAGAAVGGVVGNQFGKGKGKKAMTVLGAIIGGNSQANSRVQEKVIVDYKTEYRCRTEYK